MQMKDALPGIGAGVDHDAITAVGDSLLARQPRRDLKDLADQRAGMLGAVRHADQMLARNNQNMHRRLGRDVLERDYGIVLINQIGLNLALDNAAK